MLFFSSVWYQFALISSTILLLLSQQWKLRSMFPPAQSSMIYHCADTSWATKRNSRAFWLFAAANNLLLKQKESWEDWRKDTAKGYFSISELSLWWGPISDNWIHLFVLRSIKSYYVNSHKHSSNKLWLFLFLQNNWEPVNTTANLFYHLVSNGAWQL